MNKDAANQSVPIVLLSYSHDTPSHKRWVGELATELMKNSVDVIFDQWDTGPGDDLPKFMERAVTRADRVLMVCTEAYVHKADDGKGGVGYEAMIVTGELVKDLGTRKFIPIIRQVGGDAKKPKFLETRFHIDLSESSDFKTGFEQLLRELHKAPAVPKPKLGPNPFEADLQRMTDQGASTDYKLSLTPPDAITSDADTAYNAALNIARQNDLLAWRKLNQKITSEYSRSLSDWQDAKRNNLPKLVEDLPQMVIEGASLCAPFFAIALAGIESQQPAFANQLGLIDEFLHPSGWQDTGPTFLVRFPESLVFVYQALVGGLSFQTSQIELAYKLATVDIPNFYRPSESEALFQSANLIGWPESLNHTVTIAWKFLMQLPDQWIWLKNVFGSSTDYKASIGAYYMFLSVIEFLDSVDKDINLSTPTSVHISVPLCFASDSDEVQRKSFRYFKECIPLIASIWRKKHLSPTHMQERWQQWINVGGAWMMNVYRFSWLRKLAHSNLPELISKSP